MAQPADGTRDGMHSNRFRKAGERGENPADESKRVKGFVFFPFTYHLAAMTYDLTPLLFYAFTFNLSPITLNLTPFIPNIS